MVSVTILSSVVLLLLISLLTGEIKEFPLHGQSLTNLILLGTLSTIIPFVAFFNGIKRIGVSRAASYKMLIPVMTAIFAIMILKESLTAYTITGFITTMSGVYLVNS